jgi:hypothetical protein
VAWAWVEHEARRSWLHPSFTLLAADALKQAHAAGESSFDPFTHRQWSYQVDLGTMQHVNTETSKQRGVRRRALWMQLSQCTISTQNPCGVRRYKL